MKKWQNLKAVFIIAVFYFILEYVFGITCPIRYLTGISCAGCGMSRAWMCLLRLDFAGAFRYHPLFGIPAVGAVLFLFWDRISNRMKKIILTAGGALFLAVYFLRLRDVSDIIVVFRPEEGLLYRLIFRFFPKI